MSTVCNTAERNEIISILNSIDILLQMEVCAVFLFLHRGDEIVFELYHVSARHSKGTYIMTLLPSVGKHMTSCQHIFHGYQDSVWLRLNT